MTAGFGATGRSELVLVSAADDASLAAEVARIVAFLDRVPDVPLADVAYTCSLSRGPAVLALVVSSVHELRERLFSARSRIAAGAAKIRDKSGTYYFRSHLVGDGTGKLAFVYPGVMSFYPDMLRDIAILHPECRAAFDELEEALADDPDFTPSSFIFPPASYYRHDADIFSSGAYAQAFVASFSGCVALSRLLDRLGIKPDGVVGCVGGDLAAVMRSGAVGTGNPRPVRVRAIREIYGKTALVWGLARMIEEGKVPERLKGSRIYQLDIGTLLAGTQYRGDFENRIKQIMDGIQEESHKNIVYIDEIHTLVGAGATGEGSMDASNMLKPYLESGSIRFIGSTTYEEYNRHFSRSKGLVRRFQQIDIPEPTPEETKHIVRQLREQYEKFHGVTYDEAALDFAVDASYKFVNDRFLPDKAIDLIDEAGASFESEELRVKSEESAAAVVTKADIAEVLAKTCKVDALAMKEDEDNSVLETLAPRLLAKIYGQDEAIQQVVEAVQLSKAGLLDDNKPLASLLFVGPTGVGKTEVARVLAKELGIELLRFDMSEYTEKHTVAKLIGSPAGYVGYEDGGLLTDAIRKTPNCVLLLDEIEKAHQDIYNILLQVMDYARLTDNKGRKADFRNVILIMTSNAGAQFAGQANIGFTGKVSRGEAMLKQVKKTFKPEFINRLSGTVVFNDMDEQMATLILRKKLGELQEKLTAKQVEMTLTDEAFAQLLKEGFTREYGAREMDRVIAQRLKPLLMREILFGSLRQGGKVRVGTDKEKLTIL